jgi:hypothetical protein
MGRDYVLSDSMSMLQDTSGYHDSPPTKLPILIHNPREIGYIIITVIIFVRG